MVRALRRRTGKREAARSFGVGLSSVKPYARMSEEGRALALKKRPASRPKTDEGPLCKRCPRPGPAFDRSEGDTFRNICRSAVAPPPPRPVWYPEHRERAHPPLGPAPMPYLAGPPPTPHYGRPAFRSASIQSCRLSPPAFGVRPAPEVLGGRAPAAPKPLQSAWNQTAAAKSAPVRGTQRTLPGNVIRPPLTRAPPKHPTPTNGDPVRRSRLPVLDRPTRPARGVTAPMGIARRPGRRRA